MPKECLEFPPGTNFITLPGKMLNLFTEHPLYGNASFESDFIAALVGFIHRKKVGTKSSRASVGSRYAVLLRQSAREWLHEYQMAYLERKVLASFFAQIGVLMQKRTAGKRA